MRFASGVTDQYMYFVAVDATDLKTRETGLSGFTVRRSRNGAASAAMTTPTINETDTTNMPGVYELLLDEDMTIDAGNETEEMCYHITHASMAPVTRVIELYRPKITAGETLSIDANGRVSLIADHTHAVTFSAGMTISNASGTALALTSSGSNGAGLAATAHGTGDGISATGGSTSGDGLSVTGGGTGHGLSAASGGGATGDAVNLTAASTEGNGLSATGTGLGDGVRTLGGSSGGHGIGSTGANYGHGAKLTSGSGATGHGLMCVSDATDGNGLTLWSKGTGTGLQTNPGSNALSVDALAEINAEADAALDTAIAELGVGAPSATPSVRTGLMLLYMALRNRLDVQTSGTDALEIHNDAGTQITSKLITDAGGDYSEAKMT